MWNARLKPSKEFAYRRSGQGLLPDVFHRWPDSEPIQHPRSAWSPRGIYLFALGTTLVAFAGCGSSDSAINIRGARPAATNTELTVTPNPAPAGSAVTLTATVKTTGELPSGTVTFLDGNEPLGSASLSSGAASLIVSNFAAGSGHSLTVSYSGNGSCDASTSQAVELTIEAAQPVLTTTTLTASANPAAAGSVLSLTALVTSSAGTPNSVVTFLNGSRRPGNPSLSSDTATLIASTFDAGSAQSSTTADGESSRIADVKDTNTVCVLNNGEVNVRDCGADPSGTDDSTAAIAAAHKAICAAGGGNIFYPDGTYSINPHLGGFTLCSNLKEYGTATLRVSSTTGDFAYLFGPSPGSGLTLSNIIFDGLTIDENAVNNITAIPRISPCTSGTGAAGGPLSCYQFVWLFQGNYNGYVNDLTIQNITIYSGGICSLDATDGNANAVPSTVTKNITFVNNRVIFEKRSAVPVFDNSALYVDAQGVTIEGNTFTTLNQAISDGATTAIEFHGGPGTVKGNRVDWYKNGGYLANSTRSNFIDNVISHALSGLSIYQLHPMDSDTIAGNVIMLNNADRYSPGTANTFGIALGDSASLSAALSNLTIEGNSIVFQQDTDTQHSPNPYNSGGISLFSYGSVVNVGVENNTVVNAPVTCINVGTGDPSNLSGSNTNVVVTGNHLYDCGTLSQTSMFNAAIWLHGTVNNVQVYYNDLTFTTNPFLGHYSIVGNPLTVNGGFVADNSVTAANGNPNINLSSNMSQRFPSSTTNSPTGAVSFFDGTVYLGSALLSGGKATLDTNKFAAGTTHSISAKYGGDSRNAPSTSRAMSLVISPLVHTATTLLVSPNLAKPGAAISLVASVAADSGPMPAGSVTFFDGSTILGSADLLADTASFSVSTLASGSHSLVATFGGSSSDAPSTSPEVTLTISDPGANANATFSFVTQNQTISGFGGSEAFHLNWLTQHPYSAEIYKALFDPNDGLGMAYLRVQDLYRGTLADFDPDTPRIVAAANAAHGTPLILVMSSWSPPGNLKNNGSTSNGGTLISSRGIYDYAGFAQYWFDSLNAYAALGVVPQYISIQNEPDFPVNFGDVCLFNPTEAPYNGTTYAAYDKAFDAVQMKLQSLTSPPKMIGPESVGLQNSFFDITAQIDSAKIDAYAHHLHHVSKNASNPDEELAQEARLNSLYPTATKFVTEYDDTPAFLTAWNIHNALTVANDNAYFFWQDTWPDSKTDQQGLISIDNPFNLQSTWEYPHGWAYSDAYYAFKHYSYFVRPGYIRFSAEVDNADERVSVYQSPDSKTTVVVVLNVSDSDSDILSLDLSGITYTRSVVFRSTFSAPMPAGERWANLGPLPFTGLSLPPQSVATIVLTN